MEYLGAIMHKVNLAEKFAKISEYYKPHIAGELNGQMVKLVKANTEFIWHHHDHEDEMFLVVKGRFRMEYRDTVAEEECWILLFEPASTLNTGNVVNERTQPQLERV